MAAEARPPADPAVLPIGMATGRRRAGYRRAMDDVAYRLTGFLAEEGMRPVPSGIRATIRFDGGRVGGSAGCNHYSGPAHRSGGQVSFGPLAVTLRLCPPDVMAVESAYLSLLGEVDRMASDGDVLHLYRGDEVVATFEVAAMTLTGPWLLVSYDDGRGGLVSVVAGSAITATFASDGGLAGSAGCNRYRTSYRSGDEELTIDPPMTTRMMCRDPDGIMHQERRFLDLLARSAAYRFDDDGRLELLNDAGSPMLQFARPT